MAVITELEFKLKYFDLLGVQRKKYPNYSIGLINTNILQIMKDEDISVILDSGSYSNLLPNQFSEEGDYLVTPISALIQLEGKNNLFLTEADIDAANILNMFADKQYKNALQEIVRLINFPNDVFGYKSSVNKLKELRVLKAI